VTVPLSFAKKIINIRTALCNGGAGVDVMIGGAGNDYFDGGIGVNYYFGGNGTGPGTGVCNDTFSVSLGECRCDSGLERRARHSGSERIKIC
jgi:Ca2+-binding RTX toxin-like protein